MYTGEIIWLQVLFNIYGSSYFYSLCLQIHTQYIQMNTTKSVKFIPAFPEFLCFCAQLYDPVKQSQVSIFNFTMMSNDIILWKSEACFGCYKCKVNGGESTLCKLAIIDDHVGWPLCVRYFCSMLFLFLDVLMAL